MSEDLIFLAGIQRSGTNFLETTLSKAFRLQFKNTDDRKSPLQKHARLHDRKDIVPEDYQNDFKFKDFESFEMEVGLGDVKAFLVISKDPYSWVLSYSKWAKKCEWKVPDHHYVEEYVEYYKFWLRMAGDNPRFHFIHYNDLLFDARGQVRILKKKFNLRYHSVIKNVLGLESYDSKKVPHTKDFDDDRRRYYENKEYLKQYSSEQLDDLNKHLDPDFMKIMGYDIIP